MAPSKLPSTTPGAEPSVNSMVGGSLTGVMRMLKKFVAEMLVPPKLVPPLSIT